MGGEIYFLGWGPAKGEARLGRLDATKGPTLKRIKITDAELIRSGLGSRPDLEFVIKKVIPEGKKEVAYKNFK